MSLEEEFEKELWRTVDVARDNGYIPTYFMQMLNEHGGVNTAKRLLEKPEPQAGLFELWKLHLLYQSMEAVVNDNPRFHILFTKDEIYEAHRRLEELEYFREGTKHGKS